ncbi:hypothetical protein NFI96_019748, partial [Prochilodus magdalenae]
PSYTETCFTLYLMMPLLIAFNFGVYLWKSDFWSDSETLEQGCRGICRYTQQTLGRPSVVYELTDWFITGVGGIVLLEMALVKLTEILKDHPWRSYVLVNLVLVLLEKLVELDFVCPCRRGYTEALFYLYLIMPMLIALNFGKPNSAENQTLIVIFTFITIILFLALCHQCLDRQCGKVYGRCCSTYWDQDRVNNGIRCCSTSCGCLDGFWGGYYEEYQASRMKTVRCVAKHTIDQWALCSVCDGTTVYLITLKGNQIDKLQEGETYIIKDATVEEDQPYSRIILGSGTAVSGTAPLQIDEKLIRLAKESIYPSSERTALNDPGLYLSGKVVPATSNNDSSEKSSGGNQAHMSIPGNTTVMIEENGVRVPVTLLNEAAKGEFEGNKDIVITHVKVNKTWACGKKMTSSDFTDVNGSRKWPETRGLLGNEEERRSFLTENQEELA